tara:strand:+ start:68 stop:346 length:279 start_codon:yes stop_codon:yes gene_type:complete
MSNKFKKGQIIQRRFGIHASIKKASHLLKWGCDVSVEDGVIYAESDGPVLNIPCQQYLFMKNGSKRSVSFTVKNLKINGSRVSGSKAISIGE